MKFSELDHVILKWNLHYEDDGVGDLTAGTWGVIVDLNEQNSNWATVEFFEREVNEEGFWDTICVICVKLSLLELTKKRYAKLSL
ncbi:hypothetical protein [Leptospira vanthielii]|uniref:Uncharacterized protein n=1 Tax=Leptospira vanthielii TaxID=293085 RepID=A0ABY2NSG4_9LEPT|nr:hypothetical protein [Leptospira vanthielii]TGM60484.1 hypothetical protein EHQ95_03790 [Leptospira vanthielii]